MDIFFTVVSNLFTPFNLFLTFGGAFFGILVGAMPGLSSVMGLSIMLPFAIRIGGVGSILMLLGIYCGAVYGGSITAILINTPGTANSAATCLDGHPMALRGEAGRAISLSTTSSLIGGLLSAVRNGCDQWPAQVHRRFCIPAWRNKLRSGTDRALCLLPGVDKH